MASKFVSQKFAQIYFSTVHSYYQVFRFENNILGVTFDVDSDFLLRLSKFRTPDLTLSEPWENNAHKQNQLYLC